MVLVRWSGFVGDLDEDWKEKRCTVKPDQGGKMSMVPSFSRVNWLGRDRNL